MTNRPPSTNTMETSGPCDPCDLREEIDRIYTAVKQTQMAVIMLARSVDRLREFDRLVRQSRPSTCTTCGAPLESHHAEAGDLLICPVCGWSDFVASDGIADQPRPGAAAPETQAAPLPGTGWV